MTEFDHIHCSSRFDRSAASLETNVDDWRQRSSIITMTEVNNDNRANDAAGEGLGLLQLASGWGQGRLSDLLGPRRLASHSWTGDQADQQPDRRQGEPAVVERGRPGASQERAEDAGRGLALPRCPWQDLGPAEGRCTCTR